MKIPIHRLSLDKIKPKRDLTIDTMGNTEKYRGNFLSSFTAIFHLLTLSGTKKNVESSSPLCRLPCFTFIVLENDVAQKLSMAYDIDFE